MSLGPAMNPATRTGAMNLAAMEAAIEIGRPFTMAEVEEHVYSIRYSWGIDLLRVIDSDPLLYEVTRTGYIQVEKAQKRRDKLLAKIQREQELANNNAIAA